VAQLGEGTTDVGPRARGSAHASPRAAMLAAGVALLVAVMVVAMVGVPAEVAAQERTSDEIARDAEQAAREAAQLESELGGVRSEIGGAEVQLAEIGARLADARGRLTSAEGQVALGEAALDDARKTQEAAQASRSVAARSLEVSETELGVEESVLNEQIVQTFKFGTAGARRGAMAIEVLRRADDPNAFAVGLKQLQTVVDVQDSTVQRVFDLRDERAGLADDAARAQGRATQAAFDAGETLLVLEELREEAAAVAAEVTAQESAQATVLASLRTTEDETAALFQRVSARQAGLERDLAAQRAREEAARRAAEEAARAEAEAAERAARAASASANPRSGGGGGGGGRLSTPGASGGSSVSGIVCPVVGAVAGRDYSNDWGYPRSGGRYHQGNDMFANRGTPVVAVADGVITSWNPPSSPTSLGGVTVTYRIGDGSEWYNAHLDTVSSGISPGVSVARGQQIGTVGNTGNARTTPPHLHLGRRQNGSWVNPWPTTSPVC
jgi:murein DD-endopeptidase MepM/ murein hydrolase activator NlpD